jgi:hypothetical protein
LPDRRSSWLPVVPRLLGWLFSGHALQLFDLFPQRQDLEILLLKLSR